MQMESLKDSYKDDEVIGKLAGDFTEQLKMKEMIVENQEHDDGDDDEEVYEVEFGEEDEEEEFSFASGTNAPPVTAAEEIFYNGQIRPLFPLFNQKLLLSDDDLEKMKERSPVKKVFIETPASSSSENQEVNEVNGPYCEWSKNKAIEASPDQICKKSNSTGFSKLWRFTDIFHRSNSDGRDAFVFLNPEKVDHHRKNESSPSSSSENQDSGKVKVNVSTQKKKKKKVIIMKKSEGLKAHEAYMKSKAKHVDRLRSDLPYRPELVGFFTNVKGGMTRNVHPF